MFSDCPLRNDIEADLAGEPGFDASGVRISIKDGVTTLAGQVVTLTGEVAWQFQRALAERTVRRQAGVIAVVNLIKVRNSSFASAVHQHLKQAYRQIADAESSGVKFSVDGAKVTMSGRVEAARARRPAASAAWSIPGVSQVIDQLVVG